MPLKSKTLTARKLRRDSTSVERILWHALRENDWSWKFRRQHPIGRYIVDFSYPAKKLVIELDGSQHAEQTKADTVRTRELAQHGYRVVRFWNNDVFENLEGVMEIICKELE